MSSAQPINLKLGLQSVLKCDRFDSRGVYMKIEIEREEDGRWISIFMYTPLLSNLSHFKTDCKPNFKLIGWAELMKFNASSHVVFVGHRTGAQPTSSFCSSAIHRVRRTAYR